MEFVIRFEVVLACVKQTLVQVLAHSIHVDRVHAMKMNAIKLHVTKINTQFRIQIKSSPFSLSFAIVSPLHESMQLNSCCSRFISGVQIVHLSTVHEVMATAIHRTSVIVKRPKASICSTRKSDEVMHSHISGATGAFWVATCLFIFT